MNKMIFGNRAVKDGFNKNLEALNCEKIVGDLDNDFDKGIKVGSLASAVAITNVLVEKGIIKNYEATMVIGSISNARK